MDLYFLVAELSQVKDLYGSPRLSPRVQPGVQETQEWQNSWDRVLPGSTCTTAIFAPILPRKNDSAGSDLTLGFGGEATIFSPAIEQAGTARSTGNTRKAEQLGQVPSGFHLHPGTGQHHSLLCTDFAKGALLCRE